MPQPAPPPATGPAPSAIAIALAGAVALAAAMGLGRFAFTPLLPMMVHDGLVDLRQGSWLATLNYIGYLAGALGCMALPLLLRGHSPAQLRRLSLPLMASGLVATAVLLLGMALPQAWLWSGARLLAGVASAVALVHTTGWCLEQLAMRRADALGGFMFTGPGIGIVVSGLVASKMALWQAHALQVWAAMGVVGVLMAAWVIAVGYRNRRWETASQPPTAAATGDAMPPVPRAEPWTAEQLALMLAYGLAGFGYIITATYLPVIAQGTVPGSPWIPLFWPVFGLSVAVGAASTRWLPSQADRRSLLIACYLLQAAAVVLPLLWPHSLGFVLGSVLLGLPFTAITLFGMQEARRLRPLQATAFMGALTMLYGIGQIAGPPLVVWLLGRAGSQQQGFAWALGVAAASLVLGAAMLVWMRQRYRLGPRAPAGKV